MKKLENTKKLKRTVASAGAVLALLGAGVLYSTSNQTAPNLVNAAEQVKLGTDATFKKGQDIPFQVVYQIPIDQKADKIELYDKLEPVFEYQKAQVFDEKGNDVTDEGKLDFDKATNRASWQAKDPKKWFGRKIKLRIVVQLKENADLSKYLDKNTNQYNIPNIGHLLINDQDTPSNEVKVHTPNDKEPTVVKQVQDKNGNYGESAKYSIGDEYQYRVTYTVPKNGSELTNVEFSDDLEDVLDLKGVKITDDKGNDITKSDGELKIDNEKESFTWQPTKEYMLKMPDHSYVVEITAKIKPNVDLTKYWDKASEQYLIPNIAKGKYNNKETPSNKVNIITPPPSTKNKVVKSIEGLSASFHDDKDNVEIGKDYTYKIQFTPAQGKTLKDVEFSDDLEDVLDLQKVVVQNPDGKDVTESEGKLKIDNEKESFLWQPNDNVVTTMGGKTYTVLVTAKVKENADLQKYIKNNVIEIPNTAHMKDSGEDTASNTPIATPKTEEPKAKKGIVRDPSNWTKFFGNKSTTAASQSTDSGDKVDRAIEKNSNDAKIKAARSKVQQNADGSYTKANSKVTDKEFQEALNTLSQPYTSSTPVKVKDQGDSNVNTTAPSSISDLKSIINATTVENNQAARGDAVDYLLTFEIGNDADIKSLVLSDDLENVLDLKNVVIIDSDGNNITNDGNLITSDSDESWSWTAKDPGKYSGKTLYAAVAANIKSNADLSSSDKRIPNVGHLNKNGKDTPTNVVYTALNGPGGTTGANSNGKGKDKDPYKDVLKGDGTNNPVTGKNGLLPKTGHFILKNVWLIIAVLSAIVASELYKQRKKDGKKSDMK